MLILTIWTSVVGKTRLRSYKSCCAIASASICSPVMPEAHNSEHSEAPIHKKTRETQVKNKNRRSRKQPIILSQSRYRKAKNWIPRYDQRSRPNPSLRLYTDTKFFKVQCSARAWKIAAKDCQPTVIDFSVDTFFQELLGPKFLTRVNTMVSMSYLTCHSGKYDVPISISKKTM